MINITGSILIVDDEPMVCSALADFLRDYKFQVATVNTAEDALQMMNTSHFEVIIVDLRLPGINGEHLIQKAHLKDPEAKFLIHTALTDYSLSNELIRIGIEPKQIFLKPLFNITLFLDTIENLIGQRLSKTS
jgi:DNA-binding NtrC family response regulator